ncbi:DUF6985 domain-containing protein [Ruminococcus albus]|uniref:DUF6985 domain-containing protein n=1 Tax=Ruminococcus albus (strain ATCC 27210 / DSM 20455 / JCM 14654 / NCDO 2250 / 7) TaxID=697329 RepID=E6UH70_RUMA7|nr:hypothetical protein [Ruminococcus albus]ADU22062.1 hypothetical protein Rumal_1561 [Ruminococcus albus 7 = DSM 20455]
MFFRKPKKEKKENEKITNSVFGDLEFIDCAWEGDSVSSLFGEEKTIDLYVYADEDEKIIEENQEKVYQNYIRNRTEIEEAVRKVIFKEFKLPEDFDLSSRFRESSIIVTCDGNCGIAIVDNTYEMGHNRFKFVVETEPDYEFTDSEEYYLETK